MSRVKASSWTALYKLGSLVLAALALLFFFIQAGLHIYRGHPGHVLWVCTVGVAMVGFGQLRGSAILNGIGTFWLTVGLPTWLLDLTLGGEFIPTSIVTHIGGLIIGYLGMRRLGLPPQTWWTAIVSMAALLVVSRLVTPPELNVNLVYGAYWGTSTIVSSHWWNLAIVFAIFSTSFLTLQLGLPRIGWVRS